MLWLTLKLNSDLLQFLYVYHVLWQIYISISYVYVYCSISINQFLQPYIFSEDIRLCILTKFIEPLYFQKNELFHFLAVPKLNAINQKNIRHCYWQKLCAERYHRSFWAYFVHFFKKITELQSLLAIIVPKTRKNYVHR